jgi:hypothetical protein
MAADGLITMPSSYGPKETMERLKAEAAVEAMLAGLRAIAKKATERP